VGLSSVSLEFSFISVSLAVGLLDIMYPELCSLHYEQLPYISCYRFVLYQLALYLALN
jgi:ACR3 family arsenite efflux pump ArsB